MKGNPGQPKNPAEQTLKDADLNRSSDIEKSYKFFKKVGDPRLGEVSILQDTKTRNFLASREVKLNARADAVRLVLWARKRVGIRHAHLLNLLDYSVSKHSELCSSFYIVKFFFEYPKTDLKKEILERQRSAEPFSDAQLIGLLYQVTQACNVLAAEDIAGHNLEPLLLGMNRDTGEHKLIVALEEPSSVAKFKQVQKSKLVSGATLYQSPKVYANLKKGNLNFEVDPLKEDAFALGLMILEAGNLTSVQDVYNAGSGELSESQLQRHIAEFQNRYGGPNAFLPKAVGVLLAVDEAQRPTLRQLEAKLPDYEQVQGSLAARQKDGQYAAEPIVLDMRAKQQTQPQVQASPDLYQSNGVNYNEVKPSLSPDAYSRYLQNNAQPNPVYGYEAPNPRPSRYNDQVVVNRADYDQGGFQQNGNVFYQNTVTETTYVQPSTMSYTTYAQPYQVEVAHQYVVENPPVEHIVRSSYRGDGDTSNSTNFTYITYENVQGETRYVQNAPVVMQENVASHQATQETVELSGLKLVKTYLDSTHATDQPNY